MSAIALAYHSTTHIHIHTHTYPHNQQCLVPRYTYDLCHLMHPLHCSALPGGKEGGMTKPPPAHALTLLQTAESAERSYLGNEAVLIKRCHSKRCTPHNSLSRDITSKPITNISMAILTAQETSTKSGLAIAQGATHLPRKLI